MLEGLVEAELEQVGKRRKTGLWEQFDELLGPTPPPSDSDSEEGD